MSTEAQQESPGQQREQITHLAEAMGCAQILWYSDEAISGNDTRHRLGFQQMMADALLGRFKVIICWSLDRFGRFDSLEAAQWVGPLRKVGVSLITVAEGKMNWDDATGRLIYMIQQEQKHMFLIDRARDITRGVERSARRPGFHAGPAPYGYDKAMYDERGVVQRRVIRGECFAKPRLWSSRLVLTNDRKILRVIRWLFIAFANGASMRSLALRLNERHIPSPGGRFWRQNAIKSILTNPNYVGDQVWNRRHGGKFFGILNGRVVADRAFDRRGPVRPVNVKNSEHEWILVEDEHPPIVDRKLFARVRARLRPPTGASRALSYDPLTGLLFCGHCGSRMYVQNDRKNRAFGRRLVCRTASDLGTAICKIRSIDERLFLIFLTQLLKERVFVPDWEERVFKRLNFRPSHISLRETYAHPAGGPQAKSFIRNFEPVVAKILAELAQARLSLASRDFGLLRCALRAVIVRIDMWFGPHPRVRKASKISEGIIQIRPPLCDWSTSRVTIGFDRADFDRATAEHTLVVGRKRNPNGRLLPEAERPILVSELIASYATEVAQRDPPNRDDPGNEPGLSAQ
jgi:DNA invertase Pin-like site-specific DNA recombinase